MNPGKLVFTQLMAYLPLSTFRRCVARYNGHHKVKHFYLSRPVPVHGLAQLTYRESLRDIEASLRVLQALPPRHPRAGRPQHARQRQCHTLPMECRQRVLNALRNRLWLVLQELAGSPGSTR